MRRILFALMLLLGAGLSAGGLAQTNVEHRFLSLINAYRLNQPGCYLNGRPDSWGGHARQLQRSDSLDLAARTHAEVMAAQGCTEHQCPGEPDPVTRVQQAGHRGWDWMAENIAWDSPAAEAAFDVWEHSPAHNVIMLACQARAIGIAQVGGWWVTVFSNAAVTDPTPAPPPAAPEAGCFELDANGNNLIDDGEINAAIEKWATREPLCP